MSKHASFYVLVFLSSLSLMAQSEYARLVTVWGENRQEIEPNEIVLVFSFKEIENFKSNPNPGSTMQDNERKLQQLLTEFGLDEKSVSLDYMSVYKNTMYGSPLVANNKVNLPKTYLISSTQVLRTTELIMKLYEIGAAYVNIRDIKYQDIEKVKKDVLARAVTNAKEKAEMMAQSGGEQLGKLVSIKEYDPSKSENGSTYDISGYYRYNAAGAVSRATSQSEEIGWRKIEVNISVKAIYELK